MFQTKKIRQNKTYLHNIEKSLVKKSLYFLITKRIFDITFSLLVSLILLSWLLPILSIIIKLDSKGPVFFRQKRTGYFGKTFWCLKLRTMSVNPMANFTQASKNDPRITRFGRFLRKSNLDELPQFINVLLGDMSIVGPRPHMVSDSDKFSELFIGYYNRYQVKPGITGLSQVSGLRGPTPTTKLISKRLELDLLYVKYSTLSMDFRIIILTALQTLNECLKIKI